MKKLCLSLLLVISANSFAKNFNLGINEVDLTALSYLQPQIEQAFAMAGHQVTWQLRPPERSLREAASGQLDGDFLRQHYAVSDFPDLLAINYPVMYVDYWVIVNHNRDCPESLAALYQLTPASITGVRYFELVVRESKVPAFQVNSAQAVIAALGSQRADYVVAGANVFELFNGQLQNTEQFAELGLQMCFSEPLFRLPLYTYLHRNNSQYISELTDAYAKVFAPAQ